MTTRLKMWDPSAVLRSEERGRLVSWWRVSSGRRRSTDCTPIESIWTEHNRNTTHIDEEFHHLEGAENEEVEQADLRVLLLRRPVPTPHSPFPRFYDPVPRLEVSASGYTCTKNPASCEYNAITSCQYRAGKLSALHYPSVSTFPRSRLPQHRPRSNSTWAATRDSPLCMSPSPFPHFTTPSYRLL